MVLIISTQGLVHNVHGMDHQMPLQEVVGVAMIVLMYQSQEHLRMMCQQMEMASMEMAN